MCKRSMTQKSPPLFASKVLYLNIFSFAYEKRFLSKRTHVYLQKIHKNNFNQTYIYVNVLNSCLQELM